MTDIRAYEEGRPALAPGGEAEFGDYVALLKPRVMSLVVFTAFVGLVVAPVHVDPFIGFCAVLFIALGGGASGALNMWYDADIDAVMHRTRKRPIPAGRLAPGDALAVGLFRYVSEETNTNYPVFAAGAVLAAIPVMALFLWLQKYIVSGLTAGAVK